MISKKHFLIVNNPETLVPTMRNIEVKFYVVHKQLIIDVTFFFLRARAGGGLDGFGGGKKGEIFPIPSTIK